MSKMADFLTEYNTSLTDVRRIIRQMAGPRNTPITDPPVTPPQPPGPKVLTADEARRYFNLQLPTPDYLLKITPRNKPDLSSQPGYRLSFITPTDYEIHDDDTVSTPDGQTLSREEFEKQQEAVLKSQLEQYLTSFPDYNRTLPSAGPDPHPEWPTTMEYIEEEQKNQAAAKSDLLQYLSLVEALSPTEYKIPEGMSTDDYLKGAHEFEQVYQIFGDVVPKSTVDEWLKLAFNSPQDFISVLQVQGRNPQTEKLLKRIFYDDVSGSTITDEEIEQLFEPSPGQIDLNQVTGAGGIALGYDAMLADGFRKVYDANFKDIPIPELVQDQYRLTETLLKLGDTPDTRAFIKYLFPTATEADIKELVGYKDVNDYFQAHGWDIRMPTIQDLEAEGINPQYRQAELDKRLNEYLDRAFYAQNVLSTQHPGWLDKPLISEESMQKNKNDPLFQLLAWLSSDMSNDIPAAEEYTTGYRFGRSVMPWQVTPRDILNDPALQNALMGVGTGMETLEKLIAAASSLERAAFKAYPYFTKGVTVARGYGNATPEGSPGPGSKLPEPRIPGPQDISSLAYALERYFQEHPEFYRVLLERYGLPED